jgi:hypothetical protein
MMLWRVPVSTTIRWMARWEEYIPCDRMPSGLSPRTRYPINMSSAAPNCINAKRPQLASTQLGTIGKKAVSVGES